MLLERYKEGARRLLVSLPTGTGKTVIFSHFPGHFRMRKRMLVLAHRRELLEQASNYRHQKFERPQLLLKDGKPTHLFAPGGCNINKGPGTCCYLLEIAR